MGDLDCFVASDLPRGTQWPQVRNCTDFAAAVYDEFFGRIFRYCRFRLYSRELAEDVTSAVFLGMVKHTAKLRGRTREEVLRWLYRAAGNQIASAIRSSRRREKILSEATRERQEAQEGEGLADWGALNKALFSLKKRDQEVVVLRYFEDLDAMQIAQIVGTSHTNVRSILALACGKLREQLESSFGD